MSHFNAYYLSNPGQINVPQLFKNAARKEVQNRLFSGATQKRRHGRLPLAFSITQLRALSSESIASQSSGNVHTQGNNNKENALTPTPLNSLASLTSLRLFSRLLRRFLRESAETQTSNGLIFSAFSKDTDVLLISLASTPMVTLADALPPSWKLKKRSLIEWEVNELRLWLLQLELRPEWHGQVPVIYLPPGFRFVWLDLTHGDAFFVKCLVESDIYKEEVKDMIFRKQVAEKIVVEGRQKHQETVRTLLKASGPKSEMFLVEECRQMVEKFTLSLGIEAQCRYDLKKIVGGLKRQRNKQENPLLKAAILNDYAGTSDTRLQNRGVSREEIEAIWRQVKESVVQRVLNEDRQVR